MAEGGGSERPGIPNPGGGGARERARRGPDQEGPAGATAAGPDRAWGPEIWNRGPSPWPPCGSEIPLLLTSEHRLGPRDHGNHHCLLVVLPFLTLERHLKAVERRGALCSQGHGEAEKGDPIAEDGRAGLGAPPLAAASRPGPRRARGPSSSPAARPPARPASHGFQRVTTPGGEGSIRGPRPRRSLLWRLIVSVRPAAPPSGPADQSRESLLPAPPQARVWARTPGFAESLAALCSGEAPSRRGRGVRSLGDPAGQPHLPLAGRERECAAGKLGILLFGFPSTSIPTEKERRGCGKDLGSESRRKHLF